MLAQLASVANVAGKTAEVTAASGGIFVTMGVLILGRTAVWRRVYQDRPEPRTGRWKVGGNLSWGYRQAMTGNWNVGMAKFWFGLGAILLAAAVVAFAVWIAAHTLGP